MPTYEYKCNKCGHILELFQSMTAPTTNVCPKCKSASKRLMGAGAGIIFKGSGFYETDYKRKKEPSCPKKKDCGGCDGKD